MTKQELSDRSGVSISFLSDLTTGKGNPSLKIMEAIAKALDTPLPLLLELTDLDRETLEKLAEGTPHGLPNGLVRVSAIVTEHQAFIIKKWEDTALAQLRKMS